MDEAVWKAFMFRDFSSLYMCVDHDSSLTGLDVNYRRHSSDFTSALMAAAHHGDAAMVSRLLKRGALVCLKDCHGRSAVKFAQDGGHAELAALLQQRLRSELGDAWDVYSGQYVSPGEGTDDGVVYDLYYLSGEAADEAGAGPAGTLPEVAVAGLTENDDGDASDPSWEKWSADSDQSDRL